MLKFEVSLSFVFRRIKFPLSTMDADAVAVSPPSPVSPSGEPCRKFKVSEDLVLLRQVVAEEDIFLGPVTSRSWLTVSENLSEACPRMAGIKSCKGACGKAGGAAPHQR